MMSVFPALPALRYSLCKFLENIDSHDTLRPTKPKQQESEPWFLLKFPQVIWTDMAISHSVASAFATPQPPPMNLEPPRPCWAVARAGARGCAGRVASQLTGTGSRECPRSRSGPSRLLLWSRPQNAQTRGQWTRTKLNRLIRPLISEDGFICLLVILVGDQKWKTKIICWSLKLTMKRDEGKI